MNLTLPGRASLAALLLSATALAEPPKLLLSEDFESTAVGAIPAGFTKTGEVAVVDDMAHSGKKSLRIEPAERGGRKITKQGPEIVALGGQHWGRLYYKVMLPYPAPVVPEGKTSGIIHSTLVSGQATSPLANDPIEVRMLGTILSSNGTFKYLYNVQPRKRPEFAIGAKTPVTPTEDWTLVEWSVDHATQSFRFFINGEEIKEMGFNKGEGRFEGAEIPAVFDNLSFGWTNYQPAAGAGFTAWFDDIALGKERIGPTPTAIAAKAK
ncbi:MAG TPA: hypothetical protein VGO11_21325 [Chthoniobacteraceae bacterium]|nr:hypothetical protein [Chthoniobacteraceae bacterium]